MKKNITQFVFSMFTKSAVSLSFPTTLVLSKRVKHGNVKARKSFDVLRNFTAFFELSYRNIFVRVNNFDSKQLSLRTFCELTEGIGKITEKKSKTP